MVNNNYIDAQDVLDTIAADMANANAELKGNIPDKFNRSLMAELQKHIKIGKDTAQNCRYMYSQYGKYTYTNSFPEYLFEELSPDFQNQLSEMNIFFSSTNSGCVSIQIVFHY